MAKKFMFVCVGILALAVAYHLGAAKAESNTGSAFVSLCYDAYDGYLLALTEDGCIYATYQAAPWPTQFPDWYFWGQIPTGATATQPSTWGQIKAQFKD
jgi:hypothetical protein